MGTSLKKRAEEIRDEVRVGTNTSKRVGGLLVDYIIEYEKNWISINNAYNLLNVAIQLINKLIAEANEKGFYISDLNGNVGLKYDENGLDVAKLSHHLKELLNDELRPIYDNEGNVIKDTYARLSKINALSSALQAMSQMVTEIEEEGFNITDVNGVIGLRYDENGLDAAKLSHHLKELLNDELRLVYDNEGNVIKDTYARLSKINALSSALQIINQMITEVEEEGFHVSDTNGNVGLKYDANGLDVAKLSQHFIGLLNELGIGGGKVDGIEIIDENCIAFVDANNNVGYMFSATGMLRIDAIEEQMSDIDYDI